MPLDERANEYANRLLAKSRKQIDSNFKTRTEQVIKQSTPPGSVLPGLMLQGFIDALIEQIRQLGTAKMESLLTAYGDAEVPLDESALVQIRSEVMAFTHSEQHRAIGSISKMLPAAYGQFTTQNGEYATKQIYDGVTSVMEDLGFEIDVKRDKHALVEASQERAYGAATGKRWDVFISHASEDKDEFVRPLAKALEQSGLEVWFDETTLKIGDRLRESIDHGLSRSRFGVVVLSKHFFAKDWTREELEGLTTKEIGGVKVILPVWHNVTRDEVVKHSPTLAGRLAARSQDGLEKVVRQLREAMGKESPKPLESAKKNELPVDQEIVPPEWAVRTVLLDHDLSSYEREAIRRKLSVVRVHALHPRLTIWLTNRSEQDIRIKSVSLWHGNAGRDHKRLSYGVPSDNSKFINLGPHTENAPIAFVADDDAMLKLQSLGNVDRHLPNFTFRQDVDVEVRIEYDLLGVDDEYRETVRVGVHGNRQIESV